MGLVWGSNFVRRYGCHLRDRRVGTGSEIRDDLAGRTALVASAISGAFDPLFFNRVGGPEFRSRTPQSNFE